MLIALQLALAMTAGQAAPADAPREGENHFVFVSGSEGGPGSLDKDGDGFVSAEEFNAPMAGAFARMDKDSDGRLSAGEMTSGHGSDGHGLALFRREGGPGGHARFVMSDGGHDRSEGGERHNVIVRADGEGAPRIIVNGRQMDGDHPNVVIRRTDDPGHHGGPRGRHGGVTTFHTEAGAGGEPREIVIQADGDGEPRVIVNGRRVEGDEANVLVRRMGPGAEGGRIRMHRRDGPGSHAMISRGGHGGHHVMVRRPGGPNDASLDKDGDGKVSEEEFIAPLREAFREMDADHSGALEDGEHGLRHD